VATAGWLKDGSFTTNPPPSFSLTSYRVIENNGLESLQVRFTANVNVELRLVNPSGRQVDSLKPDEGVTEVLLDMTYRDSLGWWQVEPGHYTLYADYGDLQVAAPTIDFVGPNVSASDVVLTWSASGGVYALTSVSLKVKNTGDLRADIDSIDVSIDGRTSTHPFGWQSVWPGEEMAITVPVDEIDGLTPGQKTLTLVTKDEIGGVIGTYSAGVAPS
jgi:hypothetical protein